jgi:hypothetical protein
MAIPADANEQAHMFDSEDPEPLALFWEAMHSLSTFTARELGAHVDLSARAGLLDVGGGSGAYDIELCRRYPNLRATVFDLPPVCEIASKKMVAAGYEGRIAVARSPAGRRTQRFKEERRDELGAEARLSLFSTASLGFGILPVRYRSTRAWNDLSACRSWGRPRCAASSGGRCYGAAGGVA